MRYKITLIDPKDKSIIHSASFDFDLVELIDHLIILILDNPSVKFNVFNEHIKALIPQSTINKFLMGNALNMPANQGLLILEWINNNIE